MIRVRVTNNDDDYTIESIINDTPIEILKQLSLINFTVLKQISRDTGLSLDAILPLYETAIEEAINNILAH